jgi:amino acid adenylation domain-containing protein
MSFETADPDTQSPDVYEFPVSPAQARLLMLERLSPGTAQYNAPVAFRVSGPFDPAAFAAALDLLVARHESLRTTFRMVGDQHVQLVAAAARGELTVLDVAGEAEADAAMAAEGRRRFDLERGPLLRCVVYRLPGSGHRLLLAMHHVICDSWSMPTLLDELAAGYRAALSGRPADLPAVTVQYPDYAVWQRQRLADGEYAEAIEHWRAALAGASLTPALPTDRPRPAVQTTAGRTEHVILPPQLRERLARAARAADTTQYTVMFAAFTVLLGRLSGRQDVVVGMPVSGRDHPDLQWLVGFVTNTLALRIDLSGAPAFAELLVRVRDQLHNAHRYQDAPFEAVVEAVASRRDPSHDPVVQVLFAYDDSDFAFDLAGARTERMPMTLHAAKLDLVMYSERWGADTAILFDYRSDLFDPATVRHWLRNLLALLDSLLEHPELPIDAANLLDDAQREQLRRWNSTAHPVPPGLVTDLVAERVAAAPQSIALVFQGTALSYGELLGRADRLARGLREAGVGPEVPVGVCLGRTPEMVVAALAVLRAGGVYLPLEAGLPRARVKHMLDDVGARLVLAGAHTAEQFEGLGVQVAVVAPWATDFVAAPPPVPVEERDGRPATLLNGAYIIYTSGSTGVPKGVLVEHRSLINVSVAQSTWLSLETADRVLQHFSLGFDGSVVDLFGTWSFGAALHIAGDDERLGEALYARLLADRITHAFLPPAAALTLPCPPDALPDLAMMALAGEPCPPELVRRWTTPRRQVVNAYGPTETAVVATTAVLRPGEPVVIGRQLPNYRAHVLDARLQPTPVGVTGEIYLAGRGVARGYLNRPGLTAERFSADPFGPAGTRMYRTGDLGKIDAEGRIHYLGRRDGQVKLRGFRIELGEIEAALAGHPQVAAAAVALRGRPGDPRLIGYVVPVDPADPPTYGELRSRLADRLPGFMIPDALVPLAELPTGGTGKTDRSKLPDPPSTRPDPEHKYVRPTTPTELRVAQIWSRVLGIDEIGRDENFFDLGGNSIRLLAVHAALREETGPAGADLALVDLFRFPNIGALAARLDQSRTPDRSNGSVGGAGAEARRHGDERRRRLADRTAAAARGTSTKGDTR